MAPTRRRRMPAAQRREVILVAAEETFARSGYHGASLDDIAHAAGVSKALIYEHFDSKRELHGSLLDAQAAEIFRRLEGAAARGETGEERLRNGIDAFLHFVEERREAWRALFRDAADPEVAALITRVQAQATGVIARLIAADPDARADGAPGASERATRRTRSRARARRSVAARSLTPRAPRCTARPWARPSSEAREGIRPGTQNACRMVVLGIDPGLANTGFGVVARRSGRLAA